MATQLVDSLLSVLLFLILNRFFSAGETNITAKPGDNVTLPCRAPENKPVIVLEWSRTDLKEDEHVFLYQDAALNYHQQHPAYKDRVDLQDREMKDGDVSLVLKNGNVSLVLKNVTINYTGTYECRVVQRENNRRKRSHLDSDPICNISLKVSSPGKKDEQIENGPKVDGGSNTGLIVGLLVGVAVVLALLGFGGFRFYKRRRRLLQEQSPPPPAEMEPMNLENHHNSE